MDHILKIFNSETNQSISVIPFQKDTLVDNDLIVYNGERWEYTECENFKNSFPYLSESRTILLTDNEGNSINIFVNNDELDGLLQSNAIYWDVIYQRYEFHPDETDDVYTQIGGKQREQWENDWEHDEIEDEELYSVDIPSAFGIGTIEIESFKSEEEAIQFAKERFGADDKGMISLISKIAP